MSTSNRIIYEEHLRCHLQDVPYVCSICNRPLRSFLESHMPCGTSRKILYNVRCAKSCVWFIVTLHSANCCVLFQTNSRISEVMSQLGPNAAPQSFHNRPFTPLKGSTPAWRDLSGGTHVVRCVTVTLQRFFFSNGFFPGCFAGILSSQLLIRAA